MGKFGQALVIGALAGLLTGSCLQQPEVASKQADTHQEKPKVEQTSALADEPAKKLVLSRNVKIKEYFSFLDSIIACEDTLLAYPLTEHLLVRANPWIISRLAQSDYYRLMELDSFIYDQEEMIILWPGDTIVLPQPAEAWQLFQQMRQTSINVNIPEFRLRIIEAGDTLYNFPVRVGRDQKKHLALAGTTVDLRTKPGVGKIIRIARYPLFINPSTGQRFTHTRRDDGRTTLMPLIPWIEPEVNGQRYGQLIHPTTNPKTLSRAYSNGCIGVREADAWIIYYHAPLGTRIQLDYQLRIKGAKGETVELEDIYNWKEKYNEEASDYNPSVCICSPLQHL